MSEIQTAEELAHEYGHILGPDLERQLAADITIDRAAIERRAAAAQQANIISKERGGEVHLVPLWPDEALALLAALRTAEQERDDLAAWKREAADEIVSPVVAAVREFLAIYTGHKVSDHDAVKVVLAVIDNLDREAMARAYVEETTRNAIVAGIDAALAAVRPK